MHERLRHLVLLLLASLFVTSSIDAQQKQSQAKLYTTHSRNITFPYRVSNIGATTNVTLLVSMNHGKTWKQHAQQSPDQKHFSFKAHRDGEFWFCTRTNLQKHVVPLKLQPEIRIYVDTIQPKINLRAEISAESEVILHGQILDPTIAPQNVRAEFQPTPESAWQPFKLESAPTFLRPGILQLTGRWRPNIDTRVVTLRVTATDGAKNKTVAQKQIFLPPLNLQRIDQYSLVQNPYTGPVPHEGAIRWPADTGPDLQTSENIHSVTSQSIDESKVVSGGTPTFAPPTNVKIHQANQSKFKLNYSLNNTAGSVTEVQLWATEDGGQTWAQWGVDTDKQSPLEVELQRDGIYGFKTVVMTAKGSANTQPLPGSNADLWLQVDTIQPVLKPGTISHSNEAGIPEILIRWEAKDENFGTRPIRLHYQTATDNAWHEISLAVPNTGIYRWNLDPSSQTQLRIKLEAFDKAGNISTEIIATE